MLITYQIQEVAWLSRAHDTKNLEQLKSCGQEYFARRHSQNFTTLPRLFFLVKKHDSGSH